MKTRLKSEAQSMREGSRRVDDGWPLEASVVLVSLADLCASSQGRGTFLPAGTTFARSFAWGANSP